MSATRRTVAEITKHFTPEYPALDIRVRNAVLADVTRYVASQIAGMPGFLRFPYFLALLGFNWLALLRYGRPFRGLSAERQDAYIALWNDAPLGPMRDFVKLIRSSALLVYFDHPVVLQHLEAERHGASTPQQVLANG